MANKTLGLPDLVIVMEQTYAWLSVFRFQVTIVFIDLAEWSTEVDE